MRRTTASQTSKTGTTRTTCSSPSTTPNDDVDERNSNDRVVRMHWDCTHLCSQLGMIVSHTLVAQVLSAFHIHPWSSTWRTLFDSPLPFYFYIFLLSVPVFLFHLELFFELHWTIVMANLRCSAAEESENTLNAFHSHKTNAASWSWDSPAVEKSSVRTGKCDKEMVGQTPDIAYQTWIHKLCARSMCACSSKEWKNP